MSLFQERADANFYNLVHEMVKDTPLEGAERRQQSREPFLCLQRVASLVGDEFPEPSDFFDVQCHDLTRTGFAFYMTTRPTCRRLAIALGNATKTYYISAEVVRCSEVLVFPSGEAKTIGPSSARPNGRDVGGEVGEPMFLIGCRFLGRLTEPAGC